MPTRRPAAECPPVPSCAPLRCRRCLVWSGRSWWGWTWRSASWGSTTRRRATWREGLALAQACSCRVLCPGCSGRGALRLLSFCSCAAHPPSPCSALRVHPLPGRHLSLLIRPCPSRASLALPRQTYLLEEVKERAAELLASRTPAQRQALLAGRARLEEEEARWGAES